jgi:hypothetical protein
MQTERRRLPRRADLTKIRVQAGRLPFLVVDRDLINDGPIKKPGNIIGTREHNRHPFTAFLSIDPKMAAGPPGGAFGQRVVTARGSLPAQLIRMQNRIDAVNGKMRGPRARSVSAQPTAIQHPPLAIAYSE